MPKSSKTFIISTEAVNSYGFRVLTDGIDLTRYKGNPILLFNHQRPEGSNPNQILPIGFMDDLKVENKELSGVPVFDDTDPFATSIYNKVENGTLRMCSAALDPLAVDKNTANWLPGQRLPTVTKSLLEEVSICDIGSNPDARSVALYGRDHKLINLSALTNNDPIFNLSAHSSEDKISAHTAATRAIVKNALHTGKLSEKQADLMLGMSTDPISVKSIHDIIRSTPVNKMNVLDGKYHHTLIDQASKSWDEIHRSERGGISNLKNNAPELYKAKFFEKHGRMPGAV